MSSFAVPFEEDERDPNVWYVDHNYIEYAASTPSYCRTFPLSLTQHTLLLSHFPYVSHPAHPQCALNYQHAHARLADLSALSDFYRLCRKVNARERIIGWCVFGTALCLSLQLLLCFKSRLSRYSTGPKIKVTDVAINEVSPPCIPPQHCPPLKQNLKPVLTPTPSHFAHRSFSNASSKIPSSSLWRSTRPTTSTYPPRCASRTPKQTATQFQLSPPIPQAYASVEVLKDDGTPKVRSPPSLLSKPIFGSFERDVLVARSANSCICNARLALRRRRKSVRLRRFSACFALNINVFGFKCITSLVFASKNITVSLFHFTAGVEHLLRDVKDVNITSLSQQVTEKIFSLRALQLRLVEAHEYRPFALNHNRILLIFSPCSDTSRTLSRTSCPSTTRSRSCCRCHPPLPPP
jgi:hypothetical protein